MFPPKCYDIVTTQVSICQHQGTLDTLPSSLHLATFLASQNETFPLRDVNEVSQAFAASVCRLHYPSKEQTCMELTQFTGDIS